MPSTLIKKLTPDFNSPSPETPRYTLREFKFYFSTFVEGSYPYLLSAQCYHLLESKTWPQIQIPWVQKPLNTDTHWKNLNFIFRTLHGVYPYLLSARCCYLLVWKTGPGFGFPEFENTQVYIEGISIHDRWVHRRFACKFACKLAATLVFGMSYRMYESSDSLLTLCFCASLVNRS